MFLTAERRLAVADTAGAAEPEDEDDEFDVVSKADRLLLKRLDAGLYMLQLSSECMAQLYASKEPLILRRATQLLAADGKDWTVVSQVLEERAEAVDGDSSTDGCEPCGL